MLRNVHLFNDIEMHLLNTFKKYGIYNFKYHPLSTKLLNKTFSKP